ncbi:TPA: type II toxin-antitoxin system HicA family toxin [Pseudomonas aeruginosa]|nr:type II toxin-antitoxin system HicA family toxin [Pseudomonas aeruginosa]MCV0343078.1 type II toxin-antitoxin system HicA family toxin [Pseudomonas aeruginosa]HBO3944107.1 type II toxin-antitoxin system HicA family toxin [Pseudomonas aeruginosa]HCF5871878.1 type II toxin-antitoxin system HicA family toxin [Pseudomonas aeruginosa]HEK3301658.1 type II toxin-antitoxin system HicA family toxin [Pseudomonas aeruginosa]
MPCPLGKLPGEVAVKGSHHQFKHPTKPGRVTVPLTCPPISVPRQT